MLEANLEPIVHISTGTKAGVLAVLAWLCSRILRKGELERVNKSELIYTHILPLYSPRPCFILPASTFQSALLSSPTVSDRFLPRGPQHGFNATCDER